MDFSGINKGQLKKYFKTIPMSVWILGLIMLVGIFLRTYEFRDWLYFYPDQARDVMVVRDYLAGKAPLPLLGFIAASTKFQLGAMYYYFQITSGWIFGVAPQTMAYPDVFFNILAIPLLYYFLRRLFKTDIALFLTSLYAISYYAIEYSRFAWNSNPMSFFVLLFLLSLWKVLTEKEKTAWGWIAGAGIALGVGIQLHTILLYLLSATVFVCFLVSMKNNWRVWNRWLVIFLLALVLNANQIIHETSHNFSNTRTLFELSVGASEDGGAQDKVHNLALNGVCQAQANMQITSSLGNREGCDFWVISTKIFKGGMMSKSGNMWTLFGIIASLLFSIFGYGTLIYFYFREKDFKKKTLLGLIILYASLSFLVVYPVIADGMLLRYYLQIFFVPFLFPGFFLEIIRRKYAKIFWPAMIVIGVFFAVANFRTIFSEAQLYASQSHSQNQYVVLDELEQMRDYILKETNYPTEIYMIGEGKYMQNYYKPFLYMFSEKNVTFLREQKDMSRIPANEPVFYVGGSAMEPEAEINGFKLLQYRNFGEIGIYILDTKK